MRLIIHKISLIISSILSILFLSFPTTPVVDNLDNWYLEITYKDGKETTTEKIKLNNRYVMDKVKVQPIA